MFTYLKEKNFDSHLALSFANNMLIKLGSLGSWLERFKNIIEPFEALRG